MHRVFIVLVLCVNLLQAVEKLSLDEVIQSSYRTLPYLEYSYVSHPDELPTALEARNWYGSKDDFKHEHQNYWMRMEVENLTFNEHLLYLMSEKNYTYALEYYVVNQGKILFSDTLGFQKRQQQGNIKGTHILLPFKIESNQNLTVYFKVQNFNSIDMSFKLVTQEYLTNYYQKYNLLQGIFFGVLLVMALYNLILYFIVRFRAYYLYVGYAFALVLYMGSFFGYFHEYTSLDPYIIYNLLALGAGSFLILVILFLGELFEFKRHFPIVNQLFNILIIYIAGNLILFAIFFYTDNFYYVQIIFNLLTGITPLYITFILYTLYSLGIRKKNRIALIYAVAWTVVGILGLSMIGVHTGYFSTELGIDYIFQAGMLLESVLFSVMLAYRLKEVERAKEEQQRLLVQQSKLASMGEMISSIAHQWRQPLSEINGIVLNVDFDSRRERLDQKKLSKYLDDIEGVTAYLSRTIHDFMNFFNHNKVLDTYQLSLVLKQAKKMVELSKSEPFILECVLDEEVEMIGYKFELIQALLIVINNAIEVAKGQASLQISITVEQYKDNIQIQIKDNGGGIDDGILDKIFIPYFTTKHQSQGTGLGLYILKMIIEESMKGKVEIYNEGEGAVCRLVVPRDLSGVV